MASEEAHNLGSPSSRKSEPVHTEVDVAPFESITVDGPPHSPPRPHSEGPYIHHSSVAASSPRSPPPTLRHEDPGMMTASFADYNGHDLAGGFEDPPQSRSSQLYGSDVNPLQDSSHEDEDEDEDGDEGNSGHRYADSTAESTGTSKLPDDGDRPWFEVHVNEPHKVGMEVISAHTVYRITTKTNSTAFRRPTSVVERRYRDFLWLYARLTEGNPGTIVPPPPEKHALGRFQEDFVEARRSALESCLLRLTTHPLLYGDPDLRSFLEEPGPLTGTIDRDGQPPSKSWMGAMGDVMSTFTGPRFVESDEWLAERFIRVEELEGRVRIVAKAAEGMVRQRKELMLAQADIATALAGCTEDAEDPSAREAATLGHLQERIRHLQAAFHTREMTGIEAILDEYVRLLRSAKLAFTTRAKLWQSWQSAEKELARKRSVLEKARASTPGRVIGASEEVQQWGRRAKDMRLEFGEATRRLRLELERFEGERQRDISRSITTYQQAIRDFQMELVNVWASYLESTGPEGQPDN